MFSETGVVPHASMRAIAFLIPANQFWSDAQMELYRLRGMTALLLADNEQRSIGKALATARWQTRDDTDARTIANAVELLSRVARK
jgi:hypothetical protein